MPELPEVETIRGTLETLLPGRSIAGFDLYWHLTIDPFGLPEFRNRVLQDTIVSTGRRGKHIVLLLDGGGRIAIHLRMTGELLYHPHDAATISDDRLPYLRASFTFDNGDRLLFFDTRKFGRIRYLAPEEWEAFDQSLGIEPLCPDFTPAALASILGERRRQLKPLLLDQTIIAGLGNIYVDEVLFRAHLHPLQPSNEIDRSSVGDLHDAIVDTLTKAIEHRGTTLRDYRSGLGEPGLNRDRLRVYGSKPGTPCPRCGTPLQRLSAAQRSTIFCPACQKM